MKPKIVDDRERKFIGVSARTTNEAEANNQTAKIPGLWQRYFQLAGSIANKKDDSTLLGVYTDYESDYTGEYTLIVASEVENINFVPEELTAGIVSAGKYLVFTAEGEMPSALIQTWMSIWRFFSDSENYKRAYTTDFEVHNVNDQSKVEVYIAIK